MPYINDPDVAQFFTTDAVAAAEIDGDTLKNWLRANPSPILVSDDDRAAFARAGVTGQSHERLAGGSGRPHLFTFRRVMQIALTAELVRLGLPPRRAGTMALGFTDVGDTASGWVGDREPIKIERLPGELYESGHTVMLVYPKQDFGHIKNIDFSTPIAEALFTAEHPTTVVIVNINAVSDRVRSKLKIDRNMFRWRARNRTVNEASFQ